MRKKLLALSVSAMLAASVMGVSAEETTTDTIEVTFIVTAYTAWEEGLYDGDTYLEATVEVPAGTTAAEAFALAMEENNIDYVMDTTYGSYVSSINGLSAYSNPSAEPDYSGWMLQYNYDGYTNYGLDYLGPDGDGVIENGDMIEFDYSLYMGADLGMGASVAAPLLAIGIGEEEVRIERTFTGYDENYCATFTYDLEDSDKEQGSTMTGSGTEEDPFVITIKLDGDEYTDSELDYYLVPYDCDGVQDISEEDTYDFANDLTFVMRSNYDQVGYYRIHVDFVETEEESEDAASVAAVIPVSCLLAAAGLVVITRKKRR